VRVGRRLESLRLWPRILAPDLSPAEEHALLGREAVDFTLTSGTGAGKVGHQREAQAPVVGGVFAERQASVDVGLAVDGVARVLIGDAGGALLIGLGVSGSPPVAQIALAVELAPLIVEAVGELVADDGAGGAVVDRGVAPRSIERRLQDAGGKLMLLRSGL